MGSKTERCDRCQEAFPELLPTSHGWLCEDCAWAVTDRDGDGEVFADLAGLYSGPVDVADQQGTDVEAQQ